MSSERWGDITGHDLRFPGPIYPTPVANPELFGGHRVSATFGVTLGRRAGDLSSHSVELGIGVPVYQRLDGPQPEERWRSSLSWNLSF